MVCTWYRGVHGHVGADWATFRTRPQNKKKKYLESRSTPSHGFQQTCSSMRKRSKNSWAVKQMPPLVSTRQVFSQSRVTFVFSLNHQHNRGSPPLCLFQLVYSIISCVVFFVNFAGICYVIILGFTLIWFLSKWPTTAPPRWRPASPRHLSYESKDLFQTCYLIRIPLAPAQPLQIYLLLPCCFLVPSLNTWEPILVVGTYSYLPAFIKQFFLLCCCHFFIKGKWDFSIPGLCTSARIYCFVICLWISLHDAAFRRSEIVASVGVFGNTRAFLCFSLTVFVFGRLPITYK